MRIGIDLSSIFQQGQYSEEKLYSFLKKVKESSKDFYIFYNVSNYSENKKMYDEIKKKLEQHEIKVSDVVLYKEEDLELILGKYNIDVLFSNKYCQAKETPIVEFCTEDKNGILYPNTTKVLSTIAKLKQDKKRQGEERKREIISDIVSGKRGSTITEQRVYEKFYPQKLLDAKIPKLTLYDYINMMNKSSKHKNAFSYFNNKITYGEFFNEVEKYAKAFKKYGVKEGDIVSMAVSNTPECLYIVFALNKIGAVSQILDPRFSAERLHNCVKKADSKIFIMLDSEGSLSKVNDIIRDTSVDTVISVSPKYSMPVAMKLPYNILDSIRTLKNSIKAKKILKLNVDKNIKVFDIIDFRNYGADLPNLEPIQYKKSRDAVIVYTSGTTGVPEGIVLTNDGIISSTEQCRHVIADMQPEDSFLGMMPIFMAFGMVNGTSFPLSVGQELILIPSWTESEFPKMLEKNKPNHVSSVPKCWTMYADEIQKGKIKDSSYLKTPTSGADALPKGKHEYINHNLRLTNSIYVLNNGWGLSQYCGGVTTPTYDPETFKYQSVGIPLPGNIVGIFDPSTLEEKGINEEGEIWVSAPTAMDRYFKNDKKTSEFFTEYNGKKYGRTSDIGILDEDGILHIVGRMSDAIATKSGTKISPSYISEAILDIGNYDGNLLTDKQKELFSDAIFDCAVVGVDDPKNDDSEQYKVPVAHIAIKDGYEGKVEEELLKILPLYIKERIDSKHMPYDYKFWKEKDFPYTPAKKIDTTKLKKLGTLKK